jgi:tetratricopeptide (TPR) repeat protein
MAPRALLALLFVVASRSASASTCQELVREARSHEAAREDDVAVRRYTEAIALDGTCEGAYAGLATLRTRQGDGREAERVASMALAHLPAFRWARVLLARAIWIQGRREEAEHVLDAFIETAPSDEARLAIRELSDWYASEGKAPAQLRVWRRYHSIAEQQGDVAAQKEARTMVLALMSIVAEADPVMRSDTPARRAIAHAVKRQLSQNAR